MREIHNVVSKASRRLMWMSFLTYVCFLGTCGFGAGILARVGQQLGVWSVDWLVLGVVAGILVLGVSVVLTFARRASKDQVARVVDAGGGLKDSLATALGVKDEQSPWARNVVESADRCARGVNLSAAVPIRLPGWWPSLLACGLGLVVVWVTMPKVDVFGGLSRAEARKVAALEVKAAESKAQLATKEVKTKADDAFKRLGVEPGAEPEKPAETARRENPEEIKRAALAELTNLRDRLEGAKNTVKAQSATQLADKMKSLRTPGSGPLAELSRALAQGRMGEAQVELANLAKNLAAGGMPSEQAQEIAQQMSNLASQIEKAGKDKRDIEEKLKAAGIDPKLADKPNALAEALKKNDSLTAEQKEGLENAAKAAEQTQGTMGAMAQAMAQMASAMQAQQAGQQAGQQAQGQNGSQGGQQGMSPQQAQAMSDIQQAMSQMEMAQQDLQSLEAAMSEAQNQMSQMSESMGQCDNPGAGEAAAGMGGQAGQSGGAGGQEGDGSGQGQGSGQGEGEGTGQFEEGQSQGQGGGTGGPGQSRGGPGVGEEISPERWEKRKAKSALGSGPMIGTMLVQGEQVKGESRAQFQQVTQEASQAAAEAMESNVIPREYHNAIKSYFGRLNQKAGGAKASEGPSGKPAESPASKPAEVPAGSKPAGGK